MRTEERHFKLQVNELNCKQVESFSGNSMLR